MFAATPRAAPSAPHDPAIADLIAALAHMHPDEMSPRAALDALYALKLQAAKLRKE